MKKVALLGLKQETNTFNKLETTAEVFQAQECVVGPALEGLVGKGNEVSGFYQGLREAGMEPIPIAFAEAAPGGPVSKAFFEEFMQIVEASTPERVDAVLIALHGAMVVSGVEDAQGDLLTLLRRRYGPDVPIVATFDFHANLNDRIIGCLHGVVAYETHPHVDQEQTGVRGARLLRRQMEDKQRYALAFVPIPALLSPHNIRTEADTPMAAMIRAAHEAEQGIPGVYSASIFAGFPNADTADTVASVVVTARNGGVAEQVAKGLARQMWDKRQEFNPPIAGVDEALAEVKRLKGKGLVVVCEFADGIGQGGAVDGSGILSALLRHGLDNVAHGALADPEAVAAAIEAGVGNVVQVVVGGKIDRDNFQPLCIAGTVKAITDGEYICKSAVKRGMPVHMGRTAVIRTGGVDLVLTEHRVPAYDPTLFRSVGIEPTDKDAVFIKQGTLAQASYLPIAAKFILMSSPGWGGTDYATLPYKHVRRPIFPLDKGVHWP